MRGLGADPSSPAKKVSVGGQVAITGAMSLLLLLGMFALAKR
jgi:hypothetical protein